MLISKLGTCFSAVTYEANPKAPASLPFGAWNSFVSFIMLLSVVGVLAFMMLPSKSPRTDRKSRRSFVVEKKADAECSFNPEELDSIRLRVYEKALAKMRDSGTAASNSAALSALEMEFKLPPHTLLIFHSWKRKQLSALPPEQTDAERKAAKRAREENAAKIAEKEQQEQFVRDKKLAAAAIAQEYIADRNKMMLDAVRQCLSDMSSKVESRGGSLADLDDSEGLKASVDQVLAQTDQYGNKLYHTIQARTLLKHVQNAQLNANYRPNTKGGAPSVLNSPWSEEFISFLKQEYYNYNRTAQNSKKMEDLNQFIIDRYKVMFFANQEAEAPAMSKHTLRKLRKLMKVKKGAGKWVSVRRWEAMGDPRYCTATMCCVISPLTLYTGIAFPGTLQLLSP